MQSSTNEHLRVAFCFAITPAYTPIKKLVWTINHDIPKAAWVQIEGECSEEAFVFHIETSLKFGISSSRWEIQWNFCMILFPALCGPIVAWS